MLKRIAQYNVLALLLLPMAAFADSNGIADTVGKIPSRSVGIGLPGKSVSDPSAWFLLLIGIALIGAAVLIRKKISLPQPAQEPNLEQPASL
jgi:hypothetical protein